MNGTNQVCKVTPQQAIKALPILGAAKVPMILVGAPGGGKTTALKDWTKKMNEKMKIDFRYFGFHLARTKPEDFGVPVPDVKTGRVRFFTPENLPLDCDAAGLLDWSEMDRCQDDVQAAVLDLILERELYGKELSPNIIQAGSMNGESDEGTEDLVGALCGRVCFLYISGGSDEEDLDSFLQWAKINGVSEAMQDFVKFKPEVIRAFDDFAERSKPSKRTLTMADRVYAAATKSKQDTSDILLPMLAGLVGKANGVELMAYYEVHEKMPKPLDVIANADTASIPTEPSIIGALTLALVRHAAGDSAKARQVVRYATRLPNEVGANLIKRMAAEVPSIITTPEYDKFAKANRAFMM